MKKLGLILLILTACQTDDIPNESISTGDYVIFGHFYGECMGEQCIETYKLTDNFLYEDTNDQYPSSNEAYNGNFELIDNSLFEKVKNLKNEVPADLIAINSTIIGQPDAGDWGGIYFEMQVDGEQRYWLIDKMESNIPEELRPFVETIEKRIQLINN